MSRSTRFDLLSFVLPLLWTLRSSMPLLTTDVIAYISRSQLRLRLLFLEKPPLISPLEKNFANKANCSALYFISISLILCFLSIWLWTDRSSVVTMSKLSTVPLSNKFYSITFQTPDHSKERKIVWTIWMLFNFCSELLIWQ